MLDLLARCGAFLLRDFRETASYRLAFAMQAWGAFFSVTLFYYIAQVFGQASVETLNRYGGQYFPFVILGLAFLGFMTTGMSAFAASIRQGQVTGTLEAMLATPTSLTMIVAASAVSAYVRSALNVALYLLAALLFGLRFSDANWLAAALVLALSIPAFSALGIVSAAFVLAFKRGNPAGALFGAASALLSGVFFPVEQLPAWLQQLSRLIPLRYALDGIRRALLMGSGPLELASDLLALLLFAALVLPVAIVGFRLAVRHAKREGSLAQY